jgi:hypothetical protein
MVFEFIGQTPPESALLLGLAIGALASETVKRIVRQRLQDATGTDDEDE